MPHSSSYIRNPDYASSGGAVGLYRSSTCKCPCIIPAAWKLIHLRITYRCSPSSPTFVNLRLHKSVCNNLEVVLCCWWLFFGCCVYHWLVSTTSDHKTANKSSVLTTDDRSEQKKFAHKGNALLANAKRWALRCCLYCGPQVGAAVPSSGSENRIWSVLHVSYVQISCFVFGFFASTLGNCFWHFVIVRWVFCVVPCGLPLCAGHVCSGKIIWQIPRQRKPTGTFYCNTIEERLHDLLRLK